MNEASPGELSAVRARNVTKRFGPVVALEDVSIDVRRGEFFSLLGPSGCGKTTLLRIIAGLDHPDSGSLSLCGSEALGVPAHRRHVNTVFQSYALFPHMSVRDNVGFGLRMKRIARQELDDRVTRVLEIAHIAELRDRRPHQLSGGQKQRVALARAIVNEPDVLLLDEPLAALDVKLRRSLQQELRTLQRRLGITFILVTHDQDEAISLSDRTAIMNAGRIVQTGTPQELYTCPRNRFVAQFVGGCNLISAVVRDSDRSTIEGPFGRIGLAREHAPGPLTVAVRPEKILCNAGAAGRNCFEGEVEEITFTGPETHLTIDAGGQKLVAVVLNNAGMLAPARGDMIRFCIPPESLVTLED